MKTPYESFQCLRTLKLPSAINLYSNALVISPDGQTVISDMKIDWGIVKEWDLQTRQVVHTINTKHSVSCVAISLDGQTIVSGGGCELGATVKVWDLRTGRIIHTLIALPGSDKYWPIMTAVAISPDKQVVISSQTLAKFKGRSRNGAQIKAWNLQTGQEIHNISKSGFSQTLFCIAFNSDRSTLVGSEMDLKLWDLQREQEIGTLHERGIFGLKKREFVRSVAMSSDGHTLVACGRKHIKVWDLQTRQKIFTLLGHSSEVRSVSISQDGQTITSCSVDGIVKVWGLP